MPCYWAIIREDGFEVLCSERKRDLLPFTDRDVLREKTGFIGPDDKYELKKIVYGEMCSAGGCYGQNEDDAVYYGECDICGLPTRKEEEEGWTFPPLY